jgi:hypothetical protein
MGKSFCPSAGSGQGNQPQTPEGLVTPDPRRIKGQQSAAAGHGQTVPADFPCCVAVAQVKAGPEQFGNPTREAHGPAGSRRLHLVAAP